MKLILDEGMPLRAAPLLRQAGVAAQHILELAMGGASDEAILDRAKHEGAVVATLDADFHRILASTGAAGPSVIRVRIEGLGAQALAGLLSDLLRRASWALDAGAAVSVSGRRVRLRRLPLAKRCVDP